MDISVKAISTPEILKWRDLYRQEMNCQIICDSLHVRPGWTQPYFLLLNGIPVGYGAVAIAGPWTGNPTLFEFYVLPKFRLKIFELFRALHLGSGAIQMEAQSNDPVQSVMIHAFAQDVKTESILFRDWQTTQHTIPGAQLRLATAEDVEPLRQAELDPEAQWLVTIDGSIVAAGGILFHYNRPYGDIYMKVADGFRRRGIGSYFVQEMKRVCYEQGSVPAARCNPANIASRQTLQKAGFVPCGHILVGKLTPQIPPPELAEQLSR